MRFEKDDYIVGIWFLEFHDKNILYNMKRNKEGKYIADIRFRYFKDDKIFNSSDKKSSYNISPDKDLTEKEVINDARKIFKEIIKEEKNKKYFYDELLIQGDVKKFFELAKAKSWMHISTQAVNVNENLQ